MAYFKNNDGDLENFIQNSRTKIKNSLNRMNSKTFRQESGNLLPALIGKIIKNLDILTKEDKIIWSRDKKALLRGIVIKDCLFSDYKIIIEKWDMPNINKKRIAGFHFFDKYKISFVKGILNAERIEYITNLEENYKEISCLFNTIEIKISRQKN
ncbi:MAG: hypothetical protein PHC34_06340 [Candidatus Gastranaerophilales bacterium]|nr:hypothetical protein [Candidatus Gastranaerophilales bacterium]